MHQHNVNISRLTSTMHDLKCVLKPCTWYSSQKFEIDITRKHYHRVLEFTVSIEEIWANPGSHPNENVNLTQIRYQVYTVRKFGIRIHFKPKTLL